MRDPWVYGCGGLGSGDGAGDAELSEDVDGFHGIALGAGNGRSDQVIKRDWVVVMGIYIRFVRG